MDFKYLQLLRQLTLGEPFNYISYNLLSIDTSSDYMILGHVAILVIWGFVFSVFCYGSHFRWRQSVWNFKRSSRIIQSRLVEICKIILHENNCKMIFMKNNIHNLYNRQTLAMWHCLGNITLIIKTIVLVAEHQ